ncbi:hypothetical protein [Sphingomonas sp.]|uniref:hypothetical protein n=1 Tax=Sphingomonas sp. TaxID=28214 RepID=UPI001EB29752|nr:hypothetical protein [Sphingomonas sp.]MBX3594008.1 hypothetical protein [Sphingomonas sp.]
MAEDEGWAQLKADIERLSPGARDVVLYRASLRILPKALSLHYSDRPRADVPDLEQCAWRCAFVSWAKVAGYPGAQPSLASASGALRVEAERRGARRSRATNARMRANGNAASRQSMNAGLAGLYLTDPALALDALPHVVGDHRDFGARARDLQRDAARSHVERDVASLIQAGDAPAAAADLLLRPLWSEPVDWADAARDSLTDWFTAGGTHRSPWPLWYARRQAGDASAFGLPEGPDGALVTRILAEPDDFWDRAPRLLESEIMGWIDAA